MTDDEWMSSPSRLNELGPLIPDSEVVARFIANSYKLT